jgi:hypothetical protein
MTEGLCLPPSGDVMTTSAPDLLTRGRLVTVYIDTKLLVVARGETKRLSRCCAAMKVVVVTRSRAVVGQLTDRSFLCSFAPARCTVDR